MKLWRAANDPHTNHDTTAFAARRRDAKAYLGGRNPGFGGDRLFEIEIEIDPSTVLDVADPDDELPAWLVRSLPASWSCLGSAIGGFVGGPARRALAKRGFKWVRLIDSYPADCETWLLLGDDDERERVEDALNAADLAMEAAR